MEGRPVFGFQFPRSCEGGGRRPPRKLQEIFRRAVFASSRASRGFVYIEQGPLDSLLKDRVDTDVSSRARITKTKPPVANCHACRHLLVRAGAQLQAADRAPFRRRTSATACTLGVPTLSPLCASEYFGSCILRSTGHACRAYDRVERVTSSRYQVRIPA